jgi:hypothetical protein
MQISDAARGLRLVFLFVTAAASLRAQLPDKSPFLPTTGGGETTAAPSSLEFSGLIADPDGMQFRVHDTTRKVAVWLRLHEPSPELNATVENYDADADTLLVDRQGQQLRLPQRRAKVIALNGDGISVPRTSPAPPPTTAVTGPGAATDALEKLAASIAQRRAARSAPTPVTPAK